MKLKGILVIVLLAVTITGFSQRWKLNRYEVLFGVGSTNIYGDIGGTAAANNLFGLKDIRIGETRYAVYGGVRYKIDKDIALKFNLIYGSGIGDDVKSKNEGRGYSFKTTLFEPSFQVEYSFLSDERKVAASKLYSRRGMVNNFALFSAYGFAGVGAVFYSPKLNLNGNSPLPGIETTTGYGKASLAIPLGLGIKYNIDKKWSIGFEFGKRFALSDFLDGFTSSFSDANDTYYFGLLQASFKLKTNRRGIPEFLVRRSRAMRN